MFEISKCYFFSERTCSWRNINVGFLKAIQESDIPVKIIKGNCDLFVEIICRFFNESLEKSKFSDCLKLANVAPVFKNGTRTSKNNYRPVSILPILSKLF